MLLFRGRGRRRLLFRSPIGVNSVSGRKNRNGTCTRWLAFRAHGWLPRPLYRPEWTGETLDICPTSALADQSDQADVLPESNAPARGTLGSRSSAFKSS